MLELEVTITVFIFLPWFILFWRNIKKGIPLNKEERVLAWLGVALFSITVIFQIFQFFGVTPSFLATYSLYVVVGFAIIGSIMVGSFLMSRRSKEYQKEPTIRASKLRFSIRKDKRIDFWMVAFTSGMIGAIMILMVLSLPSKPLTPQASLAENFTKIPMIASGIVGIVVCILLASNLLLDIRNDRKKRQIPYLTSTKDFDEAYEAVIEVHEPSLKKDMLTRFQPKLNVLCNYQWNNAKDRIEKTLTNIIPDKLSNDPPIYLQFLAMILHSFGEHVTDTINKKWLKDIENLYNAPDWHESSISYVLYILQELKGYSEDFMETLIDDAVTRWSSLKFTAYASYIDLSQLKKRDESGYRKILRYLRRRMDDATRNKQQEALARLDKLYSRAEGINR